VINAERIAEAHRMLQEMVKAQRAPVVKKKMSEWLAQPVVIEGALLTVKTTLGGWLRLVKEAAEAGWEPKSGIHEVAAEDARAFAVALGKVDMTGQNWCSLVLVARLVGLGGAFRVVEVVEEV
jgi:hypothetical protein